MKHPTNCQPNGNTKGYGLRDGKSPDTRPAAHSSQHSPPSFRPRRLLDSISYAFTPRFRQGGSPPGDDQFTDRKKKLSHIRQRKSALVPDWYNRSQAVSSNTQTTSNAQPTMDLCGRFKIGHPLSCNANVDDDPLVNCKARFLPASCPRETDPLDVEPPKYVESEPPGTPRQPGSGRPSAIFLEHDLLQSSFLDNTPVIVRVNVSGVKFLVLNSTLQRDPFIYSKFLEDAVWIPEGREYYFERDPTVFRFVHNYLRRGEVHLPCGMCGPLLEKELDDWGLPLGLDVQRCCLGPMMDTKFKLESLQKFERKLEMKYIEPRVWIKSRAWQAFRAKVWQIIDFEPAFNLDDLRRRRSFDENLLTTPSEVFTSENDASCTGQPNTSVPFPTVKPTFNSPDVQPDGSNRTRRVSWTKQEATGTSDSMDYRRSNWLRWSRRAYIIFEASIVTAAVIVFMLSSCQSFRTPMTAKSGVNATDSNKTDNTVALYNHPTPGTVGLTFTRNVTILTMPNEALRSVDLLLSVLISVDVLVRFIFCPSLRHWLLSIYTLIDVLSLLPFYIQLVIYEVIQLKKSSNTEQWMNVMIETEKYLGFLKVFIVLRLFRILRRHHGTRVLLYTIRTTFTDLTVIIVLILESALFFGSIMYFTDQNVTDIPTGVWWAMITMTTVGYGDIVPSHTFGYIIGMACVLTGTLLMAYTIPVLVNHFLLLYDHADQLYMMKQLHRAAQRKASKRTLSQRAQKALASAKILVSATWTKSFGRTGTIQSVAKTTEVKLPDEATPPDIERIG